MSMVTLTALQLAWIFAAYLFVTIALPAFVFGNKLKGHRTVERVVFYFMTGNFYVMNLVFVLQLLKISYPVTLVLGTLIPVIIARLLINRTDVFYVMADSLKKLSGGRMGKRTAFYKIIAIVKRHIGRFIDWVCYYIVRRFADCALLI